MTRGIILFKLLLVFVLTTNAQRIRLSEVVVSDERWRDYIGNLSITKLKDSTTVTSTPFLTEILRNQGLIFFKENGFGMLSSPSFRGTLASHTAVVWNGININSPLTGQTDFNSLPSHGFDQIFIQRGGQSSLFGSGALGGSILLEDTMKFFNNTEQSVQYGYGAYQTHSLSAAHRNSNEKWSYNIKIGSLSSLNNYPLLGTEKFNENGQFSMQNLQLNGGVKFGTNHLIRWHHLSTKVDRNLSGTLVVPARGRYVENKHFSQLHHLISHFKSTSHIRAAHFYEQFRYYENQDSDGFSFGSVNSFLLRYRNDRVISRAVRFGFGFQGRTDVGRGDNLTSDNLDVFVINSQLRYQPNSIWLYQFKIRKEVSTMASSPWLPSLEAQWSPNPIFTSRISLSENFRRPTLNDLFWQQGGNPYLKSERARQIELNQQIIVKKLKFRVSVFQYQLSDMIQWTPNITGFWTPKNVQEVKTQGVEIGLTQDIVFKNQYALNTSFDYSYTHSVDENTGRQLIYTPYHLATGRVVFKNKKGSVFYEHHYTSAVFTVGNALPDYQLGHLGGSATIWSMDKFSSQISFRIENLWNQYYETVALRPMRPRNLITSLLLKF